MSEKEKINLKEKITDDIVKTCKNVNITCIYGYPKTGKITIAKELSKRLDNRKLYISDDYIKFGFEQGMYVMMEDILVDMNMKKIPLIIEGIHVARLLRRGLKNNSFYADIVIKTECDWRTIQHCYLQDGENFKIKKIQSLIKEINNIWLDYLLNISPQKEPKIIGINTSMNLG